METLETNIAESNILIAQFMGWKIVKGKVEDLPYDGPYSWEYYSRYSEPLHYIENLKFDSSWHWLMSVIERIEELGYWTEICFSAMGTVKRNGPIRWCEITKENHKNLLLDDCFTEIARGEGATKIEAVYNAVVKFINWYNEQK